MPHTSRQASSILSHSSLSPNPQTFSCILIPTLWLAAECVCVSVCVLTPYTVTSSTLCLFFRALHCDWQHSVFVCLSLWLKHAVSTKHSLILSTFIDRLNRLPAPMQAALSTLYPSLYPTLYPTLYPSLYPTLYPFLYPTLYPFLYPMLYPTLYLRYKKQGGRQNKTRWSRAGIIKE